MTENKADSAIRLSQLNVDVRNKLAKFDASNEGELTVQDLMHAVVTLQKQSNNYKRLLYIILPIMIIMVASIFGTTILALNLTREMKTSSDGTLVNANGDTVIATAKAMNTISFSEWITSDNPEDLDRLKVLQFPNLILPVEGVFATENKTTIILNPFYFSYNRINDSIDVEPKKQFIGDVLVENMISSINEQISIALNSKVAANVQEKIGVSKRLRNLEIYGSVEPPKPPPPSSASAPKSKNCSPSGICTKICC